MRLVYIATREPLHGPAAPQVSALCNRRYTETTIGYAESHDQALVGDQVGPGWVWVWVWWGIRWAWNRMGVGDWGWR